MLSKDYCYLPYFADVLAMASIFQFALLVILRQVVNSIITIIKTTSVGNASSVGDGLAGDGGRGRSGRGRHTLWWQPARSRR